MNNWIADGVVRGEVKSMLAKNGTQKATFNLQTDSYELLILHCVAYGNLAYDAIGLREGEYIFISGRIQARSDKLGNIRFSVLLKDIQRQATESYTEGTTPLNQDSGE